MSKGFPPLIYVDLEHTPELPDVHTGRRWQGWRILIRSGDNNEPLFKSTEAYTNEADAKHAIDLAFGPGSNVYLRQSEQGNQVVRMAATDTETRLARVEQAVGLRPPHED